MSQGILTYVSPDEYLRLERQAEYKSEYLNGEIFGMSGASRQHNLITGNIGAEFNRQLKGKPCEAYTSDMRVMVRSNGFYTYPDVIVVCGEPQFEDKDKEEINRKSGLAYAAGFSLFAAVLAGLIAGWLLDRWLGTSPWLLITGIILGAAAGFYELIRSASKIS